MGIPCTPNKVRSELGSAGGCGTGNNDPLAFGTPDTSFSTLGPVADLPSDGAAYYVVVYNLGAGFTGADAYASGAATGGDAPSSAKESPRWILLFVRVRLETWKTTIPQLPAKPCKI